MRKSLDKTRDAVEYVKEVKDVGFSRILISDEYLKVPISHSELDSLIGRLMQMCDLIGDIDQRTALKDTIKQISRKWLDNLYVDSGYAHYRLQKGARIVKINPNMIEISEGE